MILARRYGQKFTSILPHSHPTQPSLHVQPDAGNLRISLLSKSPDRKSEFHEIYLDFSMSLSRMGDMSAQETSLEEVYMRNLDRQQTDKPALTNPVSTGKMADIHSKRARNLRAG